MYLCIYFLFNKLCKSVREDIIGFYIAAISPFLDWFIGQYFLLTSLASCLGLSQVSMPRVMTDPYGVNYQ